MWPFKKKPSPPQDLRVWNEDWQIGDTAECICGDWHDSVKPWEKPQMGQRFIVTGFEEGRDRSTKFICYFLRFAEFRHGIETTAFRKVRSVAVEQSEVVERILKAKPGKDKVREPTE